MAKTQCIVSPSMEQRITSTERSACCSSGLFTKCNGKIRMWSKRTLPAPYSSPVGEILLYSDVYLLVDPGGCAYSQVQVLGAPSSVRETLALSSPSVIAISS